MKTQFIKINLSSMRLLTLCLMILCPLLVAAQTIPINGAGSVVEGELEVYSIDVGTPPITWTVTGTTEIVSGQNTTQVTIRKTGGAAFSLQVQVGSNTGSRLLTVIPGKPTIPTSTTADCAVTLSRTNPPSDITWYWQTSTLGTNITNSAQSFNPTSSQTYYLRGKNDEPGGAWGEASDGVSITLPTSPSQPTVNKTDLSCTIVTGSITVTSPTGGGNTYSFDNGSTYQSSATKNGLSSGTYIVKVKNTEGCVSPGQSVTIAAAPPSPDKPVLSGPDPLCVQGTGSITVSSPTGAGLTYSFDDGATYQSSATKSGLVPGTYAVRVKNSDGCVSPSTIATLVGGPDQPSVTESNPGCAEVTGSLTVTSPTDSGNTYSFDNGATYQTSVTKSGLAPGNYTVLVKNSTGCVSVAATATILTPPPAPAQPTVQKEDPDCSINTGTITIIPPTADNYTYSFDNGVTFGTGNNKLGVAPGTHTVFIKNDAGCISPAASVTINPALVVPTAPAVGSFVQPDCNNSNGSFVITDYDSSYTYTLNPGNIPVSQSTVTASVGTYTLSATSADGCTGPTTDILLSIAGVSPPTLGVVTQPVCAGEKGTFTITDYNSTYSYTTNPSTGVSISNTGVVTAPAGTYAVSYTTGNCSSGASETRTVIASANTGGDCVTLPTVVYTGENYLYSRTYQKTAQEMLADESIDQDNFAFFTASEGVVQEISYFDGLGRPIQQIGIDQSPNISGNFGDIITHMAYDNYGRMDKDWLPVPETTDALGSYRTQDLEALTRQHYKNHPDYGNDFPTLSVTEANAYSKKEFESSPLSRVLKQAAPGEDWKLNPGAEDHSIEFEYLANKQGDADSFSTADDNVRLFRVTTVLANNTFTPALVLDTDPVTAQTEFYRQGELYKNVTKDENHELVDGKLHATEEFTDKQNRVVLKRTYANVGLSVEAHDTYYVYDDFGNLTYVLSPKVDTSDGVSQTELDELCYLYVYDQRNRLVEKKIPGKDWEYIIYNQLDQPIMTQDGNQREKDPNLDEWLFTKYDAFSRVAYTGKATSVENMSRAEIQGQVDSLTIDLWVKQDSTSVNYGGTDVFYDNGAYPGSTVTNPKATLSEILTINYYDNYVYRPTGAPQSVTILDSDPSASNSNDVKGLATGSRVKVLDQVPAKWINTLTYYDQKARPVYTYSENEFLQTTDIVESSLDFIGKPLKTRSEHSRGANTVVTIDNFSYDRVGRLIAQTQCIGDGTMGIACPVDNSLDANLVWDAQGNIVSDLEATTSITVRNATVLPGTNGTSLRITDGSEQELIVFNKYDDLGQLELKKVGGIPNFTDFNNSQELQEVTYKYNVRGWLTDINDVASTDKLFNFKIAYNNPTNFGGNENPPALFNGNISQTFWSTSSTNNTANPVSERYSYVYDALNRITSAIDNTGNYNLGSVEYDKNGNITELQRYGVSGMVDNLSYSYLNSEISNRLKSVGDATGDAEGFNNGTNSGDDYVYDPNGNLTQDLNKGIQTGGISYNHLNLPTEVKFDNNNQKKITYIYDATGVKLAKQVNDSGSLTNTEYAGNFVYSGTSGSEQLQFFNHPEGYIEPDGLGGYEYIYQYKDHLGNIRLAYKNVGTASSPILEIQEENNYYPFGLKHKGYNTAQNGRDHKWEYLGQESQDEFGLNWVTFRYRNADPALGRFFGVDPISQEYFSISTYQFAHNNPVWKVELEGLEGGSTTGKGEDDTANHEPVKVKEALVGGGIGGEATKELTRKVVQKKTIEQGVKKVAASVLRTAGTVITALLFTNKVHAPAPKDHRFMTFEEVQESEEQKIKEASIDEKLRVKNIDIENASDGEDSPIRRINEEDESAEEGSGEKDFKFPEAKEISKILGVDVNTFHKEIKPLIKKDFKNELRKIESTNPDVGIDKSGNLVLRNPKTGKTFFTGLPIDIYRQ
ncbi:DUF6443 domain-containing protein [Poritiphilus flavus]|uniref:DUF6443 domain-containing protein n=1 Tax=Poritiphilus flavus TaxID=2697053 RepID=A0A6L9ECM4_9FLAO|nr:DUF6443 domain-containing protein [Poritiphilus flavus]NAS12392.1 hypothetical protein [Poritiphilus flavus]